jgi:hypothetical protein
LEAGQRRGLAVHADRFKWLSRVPEGSLYALVTNLPYGVKGSTPTSHETEVLIAGARSSPSWASATG